MNRLTWGVVALVLVEILFIVTLLTPKYIESNCLREAQWIENSLGTGTSDDIQKRADGWYTTLIIEPKVEQRLKYAFIPTHEERMRSKGLEDLGAGLWPIIANRVEALMDMIYWMMRRLALLLEWLPSCVPAGICAALSGLCVREIKKTNFALASSVKFNYSLKGVLVGLGLFFLSFLLPVSLPPQAIPIIMLMVFVTLGWSTSNIAKRI